MTSVFGKQLKIEVWGASHAPEIGITITGLPKGVLLDPKKIQAFLDRRKGGKNAYSTKRAEADTPDIKSGVTKTEDGKVFTTGDALTALFYNTNTRSSDYDEMRYVPRPSHADYTSYIKYGDEMDRSGGGMFSGRLTLPVCFAGAVIKEIFEEKGISIFAHIASVGEIKDDAFDPVNPDQNCVGTGEDFPVINKEAGAKMVEYMTACAAEGDSIGGVIECAVTGLPAGVGEPLYDSIEAVVSHMMFGIPAVKGIEFGSGFTCSKMKGSECNDPYVIKDGKVCTETNNSGGIQGGISNGMPIVFRVAMKPTPSIYKEQRTVNMKELTETTLSLKGRHDPCIVPRAVPCIEAACAIALYNLYAEEESKKASSDGISNMREKIDALDEEIAGLISRRMECAKEIAKSKKKDGLPVKNPEREAQVLRHVGSVAGSDKEIYVQEVYRKLISETSQYEESLINTEES
ncbi:MAG: chorismate synthase [Lachnospiraceae bacterium]|nr:chorismate synthase [Lachnospiraceae bacterium]